MVVVTSNDRDVIFDAVRAMYTAVADQPEEEYHFPTGRGACEYVGYPAEHLDRLPQAALESFAGVGYPFAANVLRENDDVLDIGSGSGTDLLLASLLVGPGGRAVGLDMTEAMRRKAAENARALKSFGVETADVELVDGTAEEIPLPDASIDLVTSNGVINLVPDKPAAVREMYRVLRPGGRVQIADIVVRTPPSAECRSKPQLWAECIVGATTEDDYLETFRSAGFEGVERLSELDYFAASGSDSTRETAAGFGAHAIVMRARKPA